VLARTFGRELALHEPSLAEIRAFFARLGREMAEINAKQAWLPIGADVLPNPVGTAPGCALEAPRDGGRAPAVFFCLPGVPRELVRMMDEQVVPRIEARLARAGRPPRAMRAVLLRTFGLGESNLDQELRDVAREADVALGFRTAFPDNYLRPVARGATAEEAEARLAKVCDAIRERLGAIVYGTGEEETMEHVVGALLAARGLTLATAESCSGGLVGERLTAVPGASRYYRGGVVAYANEAKRDLLGVPAALLERHGAVSSQVARAMAEGARARFGVDLAVSTTGISGPDGGTPEKPVGLVFVGFASPEGSEALELFLPLDRERHRSLTAQIALDRVRRHLLGEPPLAPRFGRERA
jgi:nicotinamide-nucleotide amidase